MSGFIFWCGLFIFGPPFVLLWRKEIIGLIADGIAEGIRRSRIGEQ